ncbi:heavy metal-binding domain-containing protein [Methanobacterium oryzae]|uniref:heavy metal-binding domain-containing protein n=1 Tax=Methanobacterium oryzae TaxID=69540 RepID=UPI003D24284B
MVSNDEIQRTLEARRGIPDETSPDFEINETIEDIIIVSSNYIPGYEIVETRGFCYGLTVRSRGVGGQIGAGLRSLVGGEIKEYVRMMEESRDQAIYRMIDHAQQMGANAIISVRYDSNEVSSVMQEILAYGTAVVAVPK